MDLPGVDARRVVSIDWATQGTEWRRRLADAAVSGPYRTPSECYSADDGFDRRRIRQASGEDTGVDLCFAPLADHGVVVFLLVEASSSPAEAVLAAAWEWVETATASMTGERRRFRWAALIGTEAAQPVSTPVAIGPLTVTPAAVALVHWAPDRFSSLGTRVATVSHLMGVEGEAEGHDWSSGRQRLTERSTDAAASRPYRRIVRVRHAAVEDRPVLWALNALPNVGATADGVGAPRPSSRSRATSQLSRPRHRAGLVHLGGGTFLVVVEGRHLVGMGGIRPIGAGRFEVLRVRVHPARRRRGVGSALMDALEDEARRSGATELVLDTATNQPDAVAFYEALGYQPTGTESQPGWTWTLVYFKKVLTVR